MSKVFAPSLAIRARRFFYLSSMFRRIAILGPGLLGGSIALAIQRRHSEVDLRLWGRREEPVQRAVDLGLGGATTDLETAVKGADLIILATPVGVMSDLLARVIGFGHCEALITDVGSVKRHPHETLRRVTGPAGLDFIGSHPMAGSERAGIEAARENLIDGAACIVTNDEDVDQSVVRNLVEFWCSLGCRVREMSAEDHDYAVARISHFPHLLASVGAMVGLKYPDIGELAGGGLRDTTRVAGGDAQLWAEILMENKDALVRSLRESRQHIDNLLIQLEQGEREPLHAFLKEAKDRRDALNNETYNEKE